MKIGYGHGIDGQSTRTYKIIPFDPENQYIVQHIIQYPHPKTGTIIRLGYGGLRVISKGQVCDIQEVENE